jgi:hypothetical protein
MISGVLNSLFLWPSSAIAHALFVGATESTNAPNANRILRCFCREQLVMSHVWMATEKQIIQISVFFVIKDVISVTTHLITAQPVRPQEVLLRSLLLSISHVLQFVLMGTLKIQPIEYASLAIWNVRLVN